MSPFKKTKNTDAVVQILLKELGISIEAKKISTELEKHPEYGNILAINDVLNSFGVVNGAFEVPVDEINKIPRPFIAHAPLKQNNFLVVHQLDNSQLTVSNNQWNRHKLNLTDFKNIYRGVVLVVEKVQKPAFVKNNLLANLRKLRSPFIGLGFTAVLIASIVLFTPWLGRLNWPVDILLFVNTAGLVTSILLLVQSIDQSNPLVQKICRSAGNRNCNAVLSSPAAKVFDGLSWSEVGFFYFAGTWLALLFCSDNPVAWALLAILNIISLPYTVYSIYYQARIARQWCILCCAIQAFLWMELGLFLLSGRPWHAKMAIDELLPPVICLLLPVLIWLTLKPLLSQLQQVSSLKRQLNKFKYDSKLFNAILKAQPQYAQPAEEWSIVLGKEDAENIITMVSYPYCPPCGSVHYQLAEWMDQNPDLQARIVLTTRPGDDENKIKTNQHLIALSELPDKRIVKAALHDWYGQKQKNYSDWAKKYPVHLNGTEIKKIAAQNEWCTVTEIRDTPTLLINGYFLPRMYQLSDIKYMLH